ncbi:MAG: UDP-3-O-(3-hydroxymyristoyl)glucosamine N-acyltransferase [Bdellovibrionaceae bacterium]|nr:UDP-3-O-(3-hydroxymyristoyl)glucosamine N-acyltransferase [Pseudobdellovibrionaceae bacterium]
MRSISSEQLEKWGLTPLQGPKDAVAQRISIPEAPQPDSLVFLKAGAEISDLSPVRILILDQGVDASQLNIPPHISVLKTTNFRAHMGQALALFDLKPEAFPSGVSPAAHVHPEAKLSPSVRIGPGAVIGAGVVLGENVWIGANAVVETGAHIRARTKIHSGAVIGHHCEIGENCEVFANAVLGSDGFGYIPQRSGPPVKIPQIGRVVLENDVEVGAGTTIDRGAIGDTRIGAGTKLDNLCHIAHNCRIGKSGLITAGFMTAGSTVIGDRFSCGGDVVIADHITICDDVSLGGRSGVTKDITVPGAYTGYPLMPMKEGLKAIATIRELPRLRKEIQSLLRHFNLTKGNPP